MMIGVAQVIARTPREIGERRRAAKLQRHPVSARFDILPVRAKEVAEGSLQPTAVERRELLRIGGLARTRNRPHLATPGEVMAGIPGDARELRRAVERALCA